MVGLVAVRRSIHACEVYDCIAASQGCNSVYPEQGVLEIAVNGSPLVIHNR